MTNKANYIWVLEMLRDRDCRTNAEKDVMSKAIETIEKQIKIEKLMRTILMAGDRPVKNTSKKKCYEVLSDIQELLKTNILSTEWSEDE